MKDIKDIVLAGLGLLLAAGILLLSDLGHHTAQPPGISLYHLYLNGLYILFAVYALLLPVILTRRNKKQNQENARLRRLSSIVEHATDIVYITDRHGVIEYVNPGFVQVTGYSRNEAIGQTPRLVKSEKHSEEFYQGLWDSVLAGKEFRELFINRRKDGSLFYEEKTIAPIKNEAGVVTHFVSTGKDVSERVLGQEKIHHLAHHDNLTGLPNRTQFRIRLNEALARTRRNEKLLALLFLDLDHFKRINDSLGHDIGDTLLQQAAERLSACIRETDSVSRLGGDEFTVVLESINHVNNVTAIAQKLVYALSQPFMIGDHTLHVSVSIGITLYPLDDSEADLLIKNADMAMYHAKELGRNGFQFFSADLSKRASEHMKLEGELHRALEREEFVLHYQPIIETSSGLVKSAEVLLRWQHPERGLVSPAEFIPVLEESGMIMPVTEWVLQKSIKQIQDCTPAGVKAPALAINVTAGCFRGNGITKCTGNILASYGEQMGEIILEVTESVLMHDSQHVLDLMHDLKAIGIKIALDDFGTGQSSLSHIRKFPIDIVKIDRDFVRELPDNKADEALVSAIIAMSHGLGKKVVAEGVETEDQAKLLKSLKCGKMQGYLFSPAVMAEQVDQFLREKKSLAV